MCQLGQLGRVLAADFNFSNSYNITSKTANASTVFQSAIRLAVPATLVVMEIDDLLASNATSIDICVCYKMTC